MKSILTTIILTGCLVSLSVNTINAQGNPQELNGRKAQYPIFTAVPFLTIAPDSRSTGMGDVGVASSADISSQFWNPAKYAFMEGNMGFAVSYAPWLKKLVDDINLYYLPAYYRIDERQTISASLKYFTLGNIQFTDNDGFVQRNYEPKEFSIDAAYALKLSDYLSGAVAFRYIYSNLTGGYSSSGDVEKKAGHAGAADLAFYYQKPIEINGKDGEYALGLNISNMGTKMSYSRDSKDFLPTNLRIGGRYTYHMDDYNSITGSLELNKLLVPTPPIKDTLDNVLFGKDPDVSPLTGMFQSFYDAPDGGKEELNEIMYSLGAEYWYQNQFAVRAGYFHENTEKGNRKYFTVGAGFHLNVFGLDISYLMPSSGRQNPLANTVRFTLSFNFNDGR